MILEESTYITPPSLPIAITRPDGAAPAAAPRAEAVRLLHITRDTLRYKMKKFNLR